MPTHSRIAAFALICSTALIAPRVAPAQRTGRDVLEAMRAAYDGKWYHTLTFTQKTTLRGPDGTERVQTWYEALRHTSASGTQLRIDVGDLKDGNGVIYTADSLWRVRNGQLAGTSADGNVFLPLIEGVYVQPVDRTLRELAATHVDMSKVYQTTWQGRGAWVVGASSAADSTSAQFWVDAQRQVVSRMILAPVPNRAPMDIHLDGYERAGNGWLATKVTMYVGGVAQQTEEYSNAKVGGELDASLFDPAKWTTVKHWTAGAK